MLTDYRLTASYMKYLVTSEEGLQVLSVLTVPPQVIKKVSGIA